MLDPRKGKNATFNENRAADESFLRITAATVKYSQPTPLPGGEEATEEQEESQASNVWRFNWRH